MRFQGCRALSVNLRPLVCRLHRFSPSSLLLLLAVAASRATPSPSARDPTEADGALRCCLTSKRRWSGAPLGTQQPTALATQERQFVTRSCTHRTIPTNRTDGGRRTAGASNSTGEMDPRHQRTRSGVNSNANGSHGCVRVGAVLSSQLLSAETSRVEGSCDRGERGWIDRVESSLAREGCLAATHCCAWLDLHAGCRHLLLSPSLPTRPPSPRCSR